MSNVNSYIAWAQNETKRLITVYDRGETISFLSDKKILIDALKDKGFELDSRDTVEPSRDEELVAPEYKVNIYRARPVIVIDGAVRTKVMTPYQVGSQIARDVGMSLYDEDVTKLSPSTDFISDGAGLQMTIDRAIPLTLDLYTKKTEIRTQATTVGEMLKEKGIELRDKDRVSTALNTPITAGMQLRVWREGKQTVSIDQPIAFGKEQVFDADRLVGYKSISTQGADGVRMVTYEIEVRDGVEIARNEINSIITKQPQPQVEVIGIKSNPNALTKSKGAQVFVDSNGVAHRETYYDLNMSVVMSACGQGGYYEVRADGVKVDRDGYAIIAANYGRYPRCSVVETSVGPGKVYDTGGFAQRYPDGFDIATDWSRADGI
ncbi:MAG: ubiquitin-like domain-containing protein [Candidatus Microsaccharimonas sp.]